MLISKSFLCDWALSSENGALAFSQSFQLLPTYDTALTFPEIELQEILTRLRSNETNAYSNDLIDNYIAALNLISAKIKLGIYLEMDFLIINQLLAKFMRQIKATQPTQLFTILPGETLHLLVEPILDKAYLSANQTETVISCYSSHIANNHSMDDKTLDYPAIRLAFKFLLAMIKNNIPEESCLQKIRNVLGAIAIDVNKYIVTNEDSSKFYLLYTSFLNDLESNNKPFADKLKESFNFEKLSTALLIQRENPHIKTSPTSELSNHIILFVGSKRIELENKKSPLTKFLNESHSRLFEILEDPSIEHRKEVFWFIETRHKLFNESETLYLESFVEFSKRFKKNDKLTDFNLFMQDNGELIQFFLTVMGEDAFKFIEHLGKPCFFETALMLKRTFRSHGLPTRFSELRTLFTRHKHEILCTNYTASMMKFIDIIINLAHKLIKSPYRHDVYVKNFDEFISMNFTLNICHDITMALSSRNEVYINFVDKEKRSASSEHDIIQKVIEAIDGLVMPSAKRNGYCFGTTVTILYALFSGIIDECNESIKLIAKEFQDLRTDETILNHFKSLENAPKISALIPCIAIAQDPSFHKGIYLEDLEQFNTQISSLLGLFDFFKQGSPASSNINNATLLDGFVLVCTHKKLSEFISVMGSINPTGPLGFYISYIGHAFGFGYDPKSQTWIITDTSNDKLIISTDTIGITNLVWKALESTHNYRGIYIKAIVMNQNINAYNYAINKFKENEINEIASYDYDKIRALYAASHTNQCTEISDKLIENRLISKDDTFEQNMHALTIKPKKLLFDAIKSSQYDEAHALIFNSSAQSLNEIADDGDTCLILSIKTGKIGLASRICRMNHVNVHITDRDGTSVLALAMKEQYFDLAVKIVNKMRWYSSAMLDAVIDGDNQYTPLHLAVMHGKVELSTALLEKGANVNARTSKGFRPIHLAALSGNINLLKLLSKHESIAKLSVDELPSAAARGQWDDVIRIIMSIDRSEVLSEIKQTNRRVNCSSNALYYAAEQGEVEVMKRLLEIGADPNVSYYDGLTPLHLAVNSQRAEAVALLCDIENINVHAKNYDGKEPIHYTQNNLEIINLIKKRASGTYSLLITSSRNTISNNSEHVSKKAKLF